MEPKSLITPTDCVLTLIDFQPMMGLGVNTHDKQLVVNNVTGLAKAAKVFDVPTILTTVETTGFSGYTYPQLVAALGEAGKNPIERSSMNSWEDEGFRNAVKATGRKRLIIAGLWTCVCVAFPVLSALEEGYEVFFVADCCGDVSKEAHDMAVARMIQAGAKPLTWVQLILEWQRDWARKEHYAELLDVVFDHCGGYGMEVEFVKTMIHKMPQHVSK